MLNLAVKLAGLFCLWIIMGPWPVDAVTAGFGAAACAAAMLVAARLRAPDKSRRGAARWLAVQLGLAPLRVKQLVRGAWRTLRATFGAAHHAGLVRIRTRGSSEIVAASFAGLVGAEPGVVVVAANDDGLLIHALNEDEIDAEECAALEQRLATGMAPALGA